MWFFIDFLPEILLFFNKIKNNIRNPDVFFATFIYLILVITFIVLKIEHYHYLFYMLITIIYAISISFLIKKIERKAKPNTSTLQFNSLFNQHQLTQKITYKEIHNLSLNFPQICCDTKIHATIASAPIRIKINTIPIQSENISIFAMILKCLIFSATFSDQQQQTWKLTVQLKGIIHPKIVISLSNIY